MFSFPSPGNGYCGIKPLIDTSDELPVDQIRIQIKRLGNNNDNNYYNNYIIIIIQE